ncbi:coiled-coil domain-containing protein 55 [Striga asiatica]|uniref:Coiled-coil domain-containing protein 55 n=1 Tax=Striga asiatica TaxID=4170 RepID=A0A5A7Q4I4_STRAF|nr:coiled-coil domain-containing protein 55 [Striga asiatica]
MGNSPQSKKSDNSAVDAVTTDQPSGALKAGQSGSDEMAYDGTRHDKGKMKVADKDIVDKDNDDKDDDDKDCEADTQGSPRPKRRIKATSAVKSPYIQRSIDVVKKLDRHEKVIAIWALKKDTPDERYQNNR